MREGKLQPPNGASLTLPRSDHDFLFRSGSRSTEDVASPPYRRDPSTSNINLDTYLPSPTYEPNMAPEKENLNPHQDIVYDEKAKGVQFPPEVYSPAPWHTRNDSCDRIHSRASSIAGTEDDYEEDSDYDWSGEEDLADEEAKFEKQMGQKKKRTGWGPKRIFSLLFSSLLGSTLMAGVMIAPALLIHFFWYLNDPTDHRRYVKDNVQAWLFWAAANLMISWYLAMIVDIIPMLFTFALGLAWGHVSEAVKSRIEKYDSVKNTFKPVLYAASAWVSWVIIFENIYNLHNGEDHSLSRADYTYRLSQVVSFVFFLVLVICVQRMISHFVAFTFHATAYKERMAEVQTTLDVVEKLRDYKPKSSGLPRSGARTPLFSGFTTPFAEKDGFNFGSQNSRDRTLVDDGAEADAEGNGGSWRKWKGKGKHSKSSASQTLDPSSPETPSENKQAWMNYDERNPSNAMLSPGGGGSPHRYPPSRPDSRAGSRPGTPDQEATLVQAAKVLKSAVLHDARNIQGNNDHTAAMSWNVTSTQEAKRLAKSLFHRLRLERRRRYLIPEDFYPVYDNDKPAAETAFRVFDKNNNGDISRAELKTTLVKVYRERRFLARSMRDVSVALKSLETILLVFAMIILFFISLSVFGVQVGSSLTSVYSIGIAASFIFKNAASNAFDAVMFLFVTHPFDTGDRVYIDDENLVVTKMTLFATIFQRVDGTESYYFNSQLFSKFITNVRRSAPTFESAWLQMAWNTPTEKVDQLQSYLNQWLATEENRWFEPSTSIMYQNFTYMRYLEVTIGMPHNSNFQDWGARNNRRTAFHAAINHYSNLLGIEFYETARPVIFVDANNNPIDAPHMPHAPSESYQDRPSTPSRLPPIHIKDEDRESIEYNVDPVGEALDSRADMGGPGLTTGAGLGASGADAHPVATGPRTFLGFKPPAGETHLRARKTRSRKAGFKGIGADG